MRKTILKTAKGRILAAAVLLAGVCGIAAAAWATTCFLPTGNCSTGKVDYHDPNPPVDACKDFNGNTSKTDYEWKSKKSCFKCTACTSNGTTKYNCIADSDYNWWGNGKDGHCCINGKKWYSSAGACCSTTNGCTCPTLQKWDTAKGECVCQYKKTTNGTCCEKDENAGDTLCCPKMKVEQNGECVCDDRYYISDGNGGCTKKTGTDTCAGTANIHLAYYHNWPDNDGVLKGKKSIELVFNSVDKVAYLPYKGDISQTSVTLDDNHTYYRAVYPKLDNISTKCYYKVITKEEYEKTTGLTLKTSGRPNSISDLSFYGSVWQDWPSNDVVNCKGDWVAIMACLTDHGADSINQNSSCSQYDSHYGYCDGDAHDGTLLPPEINAGSTSYGGVHRCCVKFGTR